MESYNWDVNNKGSRVLKDTVVNGNIRSENSIYLEGRVEGDIHCKSDLILAEGAEVDGDVYCDNLYISGVIKGNVEVVHKAFLEEHAVIKGHLITSCLKLYTSSVIEKGLRLQDKINK